MPAHHQISNEQRGTAVLFTLGLLEPEQARLFAEHLAEGCEVCEKDVRAFEAAAATLPLLLTEAKPRPRVRELLMERIRSGDKSRQVWKQWQAAPSQGAPVHVVYAREGGWQPVSAGVAAKQLYVDVRQDSVTMLVRMEPGSTYPSHRHGSPEQCLVLEGDLRVGDLVLHAGDFQCAAQDSIHDITRTVEGCLLLIVSSQHDELLA
jgi:anti-sigma factor ChrR (cupin superfamily)